MSIFHIETTRTPSPKIFEISKIKNRKIWTNHEDNLLLHYCKNITSKQFHWKDISSHFKNKTPLQCFSRYNRIKPGLLRGKWSKEDDAQITKLVMQYGRNWALIARIFKKRNGKQIRDRYINVLDVNINKNKFSQEEDELLMELYKQYGNKWSKLKNYFQKRTTDMIKNRFHSCLKKEFYCEKYKRNMMIGIKRKKGNCEETEDDLSGNEDNVKERKSNIKKNKGKANMSMLSCNETNLDSNGNHLEMFNESY